MKVAILTITDGQNYGNRLQNYALQFVIKNLGCEVHTIKILTSRDTNKPEKALHDFKQIIKHLLGYSNATFYQRKREDKFNRFNREYVSFSSQVIGKGKVEQPLQNEYDYFICGSDQIWNTRIEIVKENIMIHLASFARPGQRIAYAASFGTDRIVPEYERVFKKELDSFKSIGVREEAGKTIIKECCGRDDVQVVLDPTMMLSSVQWTGIERKPEYSLGNRYVFTYFLGGRNEKISRYIAEIQEKYHAEVVNLDFEFLEDGRIENKAWFCTSPDEFVWLVHHACCVLTDSFHATVFAILFHKPFAVFQRRPEEKDNEMGSRIDTLLNMFSLNKFQGDIAAPGVNPGEYDENMVDKILKERQESSIRFLKDALEIGSGGKNSCL